MSGRLVVIRNVLKAWALLVGACAVFALIGWALGGYRLLSVFVFCGALLAGALYWYADRVALGLEPKTAPALAIGGNPVVGDGLLHSDKLPAACTESIPPFASCT